MTVSTLDYTEIMKQEYGVTSLQIYGARFMSDWDWNGISLRLDLNEINMLTVCS